VSYKSVDICISLPLPRRLFSLAFACLFVSGIMKKNYSETIFHKIWRKGGPWKKPLAYGGNLDHVMGQGCGRVRVTVTGRCVHG